MYCAGEGGAGGAEGCACACECECERGEAGGGGDGGCEHGAWWRLCSGLDVNGIEMVGIVKMRMDGKNETPLCTSIILYLFTSSDIDPPFTFPTFGFHSWSLARPP